MHRYLHARSDKYIHTYIPIWSRENICVDIFICRVISLHISYSLILSFLAAHQNPAHTKNPLTPKFIVSQLLVHSRARGQNLIYSFQLRRWRRQLKQLSEKIFVFWVCSLLSTGWCSVCGCGTISLCACVRACSFLCFVARVPRSLLLGPLSVAVWPSRFAGPPSYRCLLM